MLLYPFCGTKAFWSVRVLPQPNCVYGNAARPLDMSIYEPNSCSLSFLFVLAFPKHAHSLVLLALWVALLWLSQESRFDPHTLAASSCIVIRPTHFGCADLRAASMASFLRHLCSSFAASSPSCFCCYRLCLRPLAMVIGCNAEASGRALAQPCV